MTATNKISADVITQYRPAQDNVIGFEFAGRLTRFVFTSTTDKTNIIVHVLVGNELEVFCCLVVSPPSA